jgi:hypothetical protein
MTMRFRNGVLNLAALAALCALAPTANAAVVTFAQYEEAIVPGNANVFTYTETGTAGSGGTATITATSVPVTFTYESLSGLPADLTGPQSATLTLTSTTTTGYATAGTLAVQQFGTKTSDTLTITRNTAAAEGTGAKTNLLTMTFTGQLIADPGGFTAQLTGQSPLGYSISYATDFGTFVPVASATTEDYAISFSSWITTADGNGVETDSTHNFFKNATAASSGTFDYATAVPEPVMAVPMLGGLGLLSLRRRRRSSHL